MALFFIMALAGLVTLEDLQFYLTDMFNLRDGTLSRTEYFACTWLVSFVIGTIAAVFIAFVDTKTGSSRGVGHYIADGLAYLTMTVVQISAFMRRMNDAGLTKWYTLVFLLPGVGNILAILIALMPTGFGDPY